MKLFIYSIIFVFTFSKLSCKSDDGISYESRKVDNVVLSTNSNNFLKTYFSQSKINEVNQFVPQKPDGSVYEVNLDKQFLVDFDELGNWTVIEKIGKTDLPKTLIHQSIQNYIQKAYKDKKVAKLERIKEGFIVELQNDIDLKS